MSDIIQLRELKISAQIGDFAWEQRIRQPVVFDIEVFTDISQAAKTECLTESINYVGLAKRIESFVTDKSFRLLETLAEEVAQLILLEFKISKIKLCVRKPGILSNLKEAAVIIERYQ